MPDPPERPPLRPPEQPFPEPTAPRADRAEALLGYLDWLRGLVTAKLSSLDHSAQRRSTVPSGWTPRELVAHLLAMERRWLTWGFEGRDIGDPWPDSRDHRWYVDPATSTDDILAALAAQAAETTRVVRAHRLDEAGAPSPRWEGAPPATLERVLLHVLQEYARHAGHLDVAVELAGGTVGE